MSGKVFRQCIVLALLAFIIHPSCTLAQGTKWALLVGVKDYENENVSQVQFAAEDVASVGRQLQDSAGFTADHILKMTSDEHQGIYRPTNVNVIGRLDYLAKKIKPEDTFLFYFSGHGFQLSNGQHFLATVNADPSSAETLELSALPLRLLQQKMSKIKAHQVLFFLDACRNSPEAGKGDQDNPLQESFAKDIVEVASASGGGASGSAVFFACSPGQRAYQSLDFQHSVFTYYLLEKLKMWESGQRAEDLTLTDLADYVQKQVQDWAEKHGKEQQPYLKQEGKAKIVLIEPRPAKTVVVSAQGDGQFRTLTEAIHASAPGTRLLLRPGVYRESVILDKPVQIVGDGATDSIVIESDVESCLDVQADSGLVRGVTLRHKAAESGKKLFAVEIEKGRLALEDCDITNEKLGGVSIYGGADPVLARCRIHDCKTNGVLVYGKSRGTIVDCDVFGNGLAGVEISEGSETVVRDCKIHDGKGNGINIHTSGRGRVENCDIYGNEFGGIQIGEDGDPLVEDCKIHNGKSTGIFIYMKGLGRIRNCNIFGNKLSGVEIKEEGNPTLTDCQIHDGETNAINVHTNGRGRFDLCDIYGNKASQVQISEDGDPMLIDCRIHDSFVGVFSFDGGRGIVENCSISDHKASGALLVGSKNITLRRCGIKDNNIGIVALKEAKGTIENCTFTGNKRDTQIDPGTEIEQVSDK